ncbi:uncharacterized protein BT62DRAFT_1080799 [Guyanagaster necrorhizus]|uniref:Uncharacterized protein n=1 Tax=Guyanagaster necrorhizus TaxID=856835 RepID=A0A9P7VHB8_9AGAR|nr:uncharacterized protein BT62DRAFT_1080799 [Guyanagaster necrorhizus MCA 3950]KAG7440562.1 hypothetical protein BT62DRAFT_1080799 [Guyanagaster necrorhizus MCA 3950]
MYISLSRKTSYSDEYDDVYLDIWVPEIYGLSATNLKRYLGVRPSIRKEYGVALHDIIEARKTGNSIIPIQADEGEESQEKRDEEERDDMTQPAPTFGVKGTCEEDLVEDREKRQDTGRVFNGGSKLAVADSGPTSTEALEQYPNPFREMEAKSQLAGFIVLCYSGIVQENLSSSTISFYYAYKAKKPTILVSVLM